MNQILYTGKNKSKADVNKVLRVFTVLLVIFAICFIAFGVYLYNGTRQRDDVASNQPVEQTPKVESKIDIAFASIVDGVRVRIRSNIEIATATYRWDNEPENNIEIDRESKADVIKEIPIKQGTHTLNITVIDTEGNKQTKEQEVIGDKEPELVITTNGTDKYVIRAKDDEKLSRIKITLNNEVVLEQELDTAEFEYTVAIPQGDSLIETTVYNINDLVNTKRGRITGYSR